MRKLKSIKQLLEEFPDAEFDTYGNLCCSKWVVNIIRESLEYFGKNYMEHSLTTFDGQWFEKEEAKKLYAYEEPLGDTIRRIDFYIEEINPSPGFAERAPEYDISYPMNHDQEK